MRHLRTGRKLNITDSHRRAMLSNMATSLFDKERIETTKVKAKEVRPFVERLITYGKNGSLHDIRLASRTIRDKAMLHKLFNDIAPGYKERAGGYTRILTVRNRVGDNAEMAIIELVGRSGEAVRNRKKKKKSSAASRTSQQKSVNTGKNSQDNIATEQMEKSGTEEQK